MPHPHLPSWSDMTDMAVSRERKTMLVFNCFSLFCSITFSFFCYRFLGPTPQGYRAHTYKSSSHRPLLYLSRKHQSFKGSTTLRYPYQQIKVRSQLVASITKKHGSMQHQRPVVPTKSEHSINLTGGKNPKCEISPPLTFRRLQSNNASTKIIQT